MPKLELLKPAEYPTDGQHQTPVADMPSSHAGAGSTPLFDTVSIQQAETIQLPNAGRIVPVPVEDPKNRWLGDGLPQLPDGFRFPQNDAVTQNNAITQNDAVTQNDAGTADGQVVNEASSEVALIQPWWLQVQQSTDSPGLSLALEDLVWEAITHSPHVQAVLLEPQILDAQATAKLGVFDPNRFVDTIFKDTSDPVGNTLITGGPPRLNDNLWENRGGVRAKNQYGGQSELFQELQFKNSNSRFFVPGEQAESRLVLQYTQPLRRGRGAEYNRASFVIASIAAEQGRFQASLALQDHVYQITQAYWNLYSARIVLQQIDRGMVNLGALRDRLQGRTDIDTLRSQVLRAEAAIAKQSAVRAAAVAQLLTSEAALRALVASPQLRNSPVPIVPTTPSLNTPPQIDVNQERLAALESQPKILEVQEEIKAARTKLRVAQNELQPTLNLVLQGYLRGLSGNYDLGNSLEDQFTSSPSYHAGFSYQRPKGNIAAQAIARESRIELRKSLLRLDDTLLTVSANVEAAAASLQASFIQLDAAVRATLATQAEIQFLEYQWNDAFASSDVRTSLQLDQLLNAHIQLVSTENSWVQAERDYMLAYAKLALTTGRLLAATPLP